MGHACAEGDDGKVSLARDVGGRLNRQSSLLFNNPVLHCRTILFSFCAALGHTFGFKSFGEGEQAKYPICTASFTDCC